MALKYRDQVFHDAGCACCTADASPLATDPTGTASIRRQWRLALGTRWTLVRNSIRQNLIDRDMLGMNGGSVTSSMVALAAASQGETKIKTFQSYLDMTLSSVILAGDGATAKPFIELAYQKGLRFARTITGQTLLMPPQISTSRIDAITALAVVELQGIAEAVSQKAVREVANAIIQNKRAIVAFRAITTTIEKIGVNRSNAVVELLTVAAFNAATLDYYEALGITDVGLLPEAKVGDSITDAKKKKARKRKTSARPRKGAGTRISRKKQPSASTIARILRKEQQLEGLGAWVNVRTAGDEKVCPICEAIEEGGPYKIDAARALIPAHPRCRCAFIPARKPRKLKKDFNPYHEPAGSKIGGRFARASGTPNDVDDLVAPTDSEKANEDREKSLSGKLTTEEKQAIHDYTSFDYGPINYSLRGGPSEDEDGGGPYPNADYKEMDKKISGLDKAFAKVSLNRDMTTYRGLSSHRIAEVEMSEDGTEFVDFGYVSSSARKSVADEFYSEGAGVLTDNTSIRIFSPKGSKVIPIGTMGANSEESEFLINRGSHFIKRRDASGHTYLELVVK